MWKSIQPIYDFYDHHAQKLITNRLIKEDGDLIKTRALLILWSCTTVVMWFYVLYCLLAFPLSSPVPWAGLLVTIIHTAAPWVFKYTQSFLAAGLTISLSGLGFQTFFCLYTGGVYSPAAIWLTFHPVILGFFGNTGWIIFSVTLNTLIIVGMYIAGQMNLLPQDDLPKLFRDGMIITSYVGLDVLVAAFTATAIRINLKKNQELRKSKELTENLVRVLCHDINNPLSVIKIASEFLHKTNPDTSQFSEKIIRAGHDIQRITEAVNSWISHRDGKRVMDNELITVKEIIEHIEFSFEDKLREKNLTLKISKTSDDHCIWGDKSAVLYQVLNNLISNAIKFSFENSHIEVRFSSDTSKVCIEIRDHGVGISEGLIEKVFSPFAVTSRPGTHNETGTGFGLPIVAAVIERMDGQISIENMKKIPGEQGTLVKVVLKSQCDL